MPDPKGFLVVPVAFTNTGLLRALYVDDADRLKVLVDNPDPISVVLGASDAVIGTVSSRMHGWSGTTWYKQPMIRGYSGILDEYLTNFNCSAGTNVLNSSLVPRGFVWEVELIAYFFTTAPCTSGRIQLFSSGVEIIVQEVVPPYTARWICHQYRFTMAENAFLRMTCYGMAAGDDMYFRIHGLKYRIEA